MVTSFRFQAGRIPAYTLHKSTGQARTRVAGRDYYLGLYGSVESRQRYGELIATCASGVDIAPDKLKAGTKIDPGQFTVNELCLAFMRHAEQHYRKGGEPTDEIDCFKSAIRVLVDLYGHEMVNDLGPIKLKAVRGKMVSKGWCRKYVNRSVNRLRHIFRWGVAGELVEPTTLQKLEALAPLLIGRTEAPDHPQRQAVPQEHIDAVRKIVSAQCRDLIDLQLTSGARPGELLLLTSGMIDRSGEVWTAELREHKTQHRGKTRRLAFGPKSQLILRRHLQADPDAKLFRIRRNAYRTAVVRACEKLEIPRWTPHWLRHNVATKVRDEFGIEAAQAMAGHASPLMTNHYASKMNVLAEQVAKLIG